MTAIKINIKNYSCKTLCLKFKIKSLRFRTYVKHAMLFILNYITLICIYSKGLGQRKYVYNNIIYRLLFVYVYNKQQL